MQHDYISSFIKKLSSLFLSLYCKEVARNWNPSEWWDHLKLQFFVTRLQKKRYLLIIQRQTISTPFNCILRTLVLSRTNKTNENDLFEWDEIKCFSDVVFKWFWCCLSSALSEGIECKCNWSNGFFSVATLR